MSHLPDHSRARVPCQGSSISVTTPQRLPGRTRADLQVSKKAGRDGLGSIRLRNSAATRQGSLEPPEKTVIDPNSPKFSAFSIDHLRRTSPCNRNRFGKRCTETSVRLYTQGRHQKTSHPITSILRSSLNKPRKRISLTAAPLKQGSVIVASTSYFVQTDRNRSIMIADTCSPLGQGRVSVVSLLSL